MAYLDKYSDEDLFELLKTDVEEELHKRGYEYGWHKRVQYAGNIYILVNPAFPNLVKIGYADNVEKRVKQFNSNSGLPDPYHIFATYKVKKRLEDLKLHNLIDSLDSDLRHSKNREFYEMSPEKAYEILSAIAQINGDEDLLILNPLDDDFFIKEEPQEQKQPRNSYKSDKDTLPEGTYYMRKKLKSWGNNEVSGTMEYKNGKFIVKAGSICSPIRGKGWTTTKAIDIAREKSTIIDNVLQNDYEFNSPSSAAAMITWTPEAGWNVWKTEDGEEIDIYRKKQK